MQRCTILFQVQFLYIREYILQSFRIQFLTYGDLFTRYIAVFTKTEMRFRRKKWFDNSYAAFFYFMSTAREKAFPDPRIFLRSRGPGLYGLMHSRIAFLADSYVVMLHNRYVRTYIHTYVYGSYVSNQLRSGNSWRDVPPTNQFYPSWNRPPSFVVQFRRLRRSTRWRPAVTSPGHRLPVPSENRSVKD